MPGEFYKVVRPNDLPDVQGQYLSYWVDPPLGLTYTLGRRTTPQIGGILVFGTLDDAQGFRCPGNVILRGVGERTRLPQYRLFLTERLCEPADREETWQKLRWIWKEEWVSHRCECMCWPVGTVALAWFEPQEIVT